MLYLMNSPILTEYGDWRFEGPLSITHARELILGKSFVSAIGHEGSAKFLTKLLKLEIPVNRIAINMAAGDQALVLRLLSRLPEGVVLDDVEMQAIPFSLSMLTRLS